MVIVAVEGEQEKLDSKGRERREFAGRLVTRARWLARALTYPGT